MRLCRRKGWIEARLIGEVGLGKTKTPKKKQEQMVGLLVGFGGFGLKG